MPKITVEFSSLEEFMAFRGGAAVEAPKTEVVETDKPKRTRAKKDEPVIVPEPEQPPAVIEAAAPAFPVVTEQPANPFPESARPAPVDRLAACHGGSR